MAELVKMIGENEPSIMTIVKNDSDMLYASINLNVCKNMNGTYEWDALVLPDFALNNIHNADSETKRSVLIAHIIKGYYDDNKMSAIINNYLMDQEDTKHKLEFDEMQKVRKLAKEIANYIVTNNLF